MKIIDEKGRLFGLINLVDLLVILLVVFAIVFGIKRFVLKPDESAMMKDAKITFELAGVREASVDALNIGDLLYWADRFVELGKISEINKKPYEEALELDGEWVNKPVPGKFTVNFTIDAKVKDDGTVYWLAGEQIRLGIKYMIKTKFINMESHVVGFDVLD
ncbi:MAG: DUF4330 domain-containing protein [Firmicutes bacterium]|nr:DUF4330 domain-containing protein [Bacillota bacterium]